MIDYRDRQIAIQGELILQQALLLREYESKLRELQNIVKQLVDESQEAEEL